MGIYLDVHRLPVDPAVDILTRRKWFYDLETHYPELLEERLGFQNKEVPPNPPRVLDFQKRYHHVLDAMTGTINDRFAGEFIHKEPDDPRWRAIYGARLINWEWQDFPLRYCLQKDIEEICEAVDKMSAENLRQNIEQILEKDKDYYTSERIRDWMRQQLGTNLLPALRQFYGVAHDEEQIVVYRLH